jgi:hypothetical protein
MTFVVGSLLLVETKDVDIVEAVASRRTSSPDE